MEVRVAGGALLEVASKADLAEHFERLSNLLAKPHARFQRLAAGRAPRAGNVPFVIDLGAPPGGMMWRVEWVVLVGDDPTASTAIANVRAALFAGAIANDASLSGSAPIVGTDFAGVLQSGIIVPSTTSVPDESFVYSNEHLYLVIGGTGTVAGAGNYHAVVGVIELPQTPEALTW